MTVGLHFCTIGLTCGVLGRPLGPPWGTKRNPWGHPGAPSQPGTKNNQKNHFLVTCFEAQIEWHFSSFPVLAFTCLAGMVNDAQMSPKSNKRGAEIAHCRRQRSNWETTFRLRRRERIEGQACWKTCQIKLKTARKRTLGTYMIFCKIWQERL